MKLLPTLLLAAFACPLLSQESSECSELFISEVLVGEQATSDERQLLPDSTWSYAVEIYNPTERDITLSSYLIGLVTEDGGRDTIQLQDSIHSQETYVIANSNCHDSIKSRADQLDSNFIFDGYVGLELVGADGVITQIGKPGLGDPDEINVDSLFNDPYYLQQININLSSIENLSARRYPYINKTYPDFDRDTFVFTHYFRPDEMYEHLGVYHSSCFQPVVHWERNPNNPSGGAFTVKSEGYPFTIDWNYICEQYDELTDDIQLRVRNDEDNLGGQHPIANLGEDYELTANFGFDQTYDFWLDTGLVASNNTYMASVNLCNIIDDNIEDSVGSGVAGEQTIFILSINNANNTGVTVAPPNVFGLTILDNENTGIEQLKKLHSDIKLYPTVFRNETKIYNLSKSTRILSLQFVSADGKTLYQRDFGKNVNHEEIPIKLENTPSSGIGYFIIKTDHGTIVKKGASIK